MSWVACTRMYDVTPVARAHWHALLQRAAGNAGVALECIDHAAPKPLTDLWSREDLALAFMCGFPFATRYPHVRPIAAPVTVIADGESPTYRSLWLVRKESAFDTLASTFGHRIGWTVEHSYSGFIAPRSVLLDHRTKERSQLYAESVGPLLHPRAALAALADGSIDVTAVDSYWWWLFERYDATLALSFRQVGFTPSAPMPLLVCADGFPDELAQRLSAALVAVHEDEAADPHMSALGVVRFATVARASYVVLADADRAAHEAGYPLPA